MATGIAFLLGIVIGWISAWLFRPPRPRWPYPDVDRGNGSPLAILAKSFLIVCALVWLAKQGSIEQTLSWLVLAVFAAVVVAALFLVLSADEPEIAWARLLALSAMLPATWTSLVAALKRASRIETALVLAGVALAVTFLYGTEEAVWWPVVIWLSQPTRLWAALGLLIGICAGANHALASRKAADFYAALLGSNEGSSWALRAVVGVLILVLVVEVVNPSLVDHLTEFHAGQFEAKFGEVSSETRDAVSLGLNEFNLDTRMTIWIGFADKLSTTEPRGAAEVKFDGTSDPLRRDRANLRQAFFKNYLNTLVVIISFMEDDDRSETIRSDPNLIEFFENFRSAIENETGDGSAFNWPRLLAQLQGSIDSLSGKLVDVHAKSDTCIKYKSAFRPFKQVAEEISEKGDAKIVKKGEDKIVTDDARTSIGSFAKSNDLNNFPLAWFDPYIVAVEADLIAVMTSQTDKASFLSEIEHKYPDDESHISPGLINLQYQIADSMYKSKARWPLVDKLDHIHRSIGHAEFYISKNRFPDPTSIDRSIENLYATNKIIFSTLLLETLNVEGLSGARIEPAQHREWSQTYAFLEQVLQSEAEDAGTRVVAGGVSAIPAAEKEVWAAAYDNVVPEYRFDIFVSMALGATMLTSQRGHATALGCETAYFYQSKAVGELPKFENDYSVSERLQLKGYLSQVKTRIDAGCT